MEQHIGLTLPGGGARAAYQAGVLRAIYDICKFQKNPFRAISGISAGAINGMWLATEADDLENGTALMCDMWKKLSVGDVFKTDTMTLLTTGARWLRNLSLGELFGKSRMTYLLETSPLEKLLKEKINFEKIQHHLDTGVLHALALTATDYTLASPVTFFAGDDSITPWHGSVSRGVRTKLTEKHVMASASIPIFFPPVRIEGRNYGDGGIGLRTPLSPVIHMGASRILVIGVDNPLLYDPKRDTKPVPPATLGDVSGTLLNSLFLNSLNADLDRLKKINRATEMLTAAELKNNINHRRNIPVLVIRPSRDLTKVGEQEFSNFPFTIRHLLKGLGIDERKGWDLLSYIAFDQAYSAALLDLGYSDAMDKKDDVLKFFEDA